MFQVYGIAMPRRPARPGELGHMGCTGSIRPAHAIPAPSFTAARVGPASGPPAPPGAQAGSPH